MRKRLKIFSAVFAFILAGVSLMSACGGKSKGERIPTAKNAVSLLEEHLQTNGLHEVSVKDADRPFITGQDSPYSIVIDDSEAALKAANFINKHLFAVTGTMLSVIRGGEQKYTTDKKWIVLGREDILAQAGVSVPTEVGQTGYRIKTVNDSVFIGTLNALGLQTGAIAFLRYTVGYEMYSEDTVSYSLDGSELPDMDIIEKPDFEYHLQGNSSSQTALYGMGFVNTSDVFIAVGGVRWHNSFGFISPDEWYDSHPAWFADDKLQLCYTAHGETEEYEAMQAQVLNVTKELIDGNPSVNNVTFTIQDTTTECECAACKAEKEKYGTGSAAIIKFCNDLSDKVQEYLEEQAKESGGSKREFNIVFFAYQKTEKPPVIKENGTYRAADETVICGDHVGVYIAPIGAAYNQSFYHEDNAAAAEVIRGWSAICSKLFIWPYETNFHYYMYPFNSYDTMIETYRFCKENNAVFVMNEGQYNQGNVTCFGKLKEYLNSKAEFDVNVNYLEITDDFFENYFREAAAPMRGYYDELVAHLRYLEETYPAEITGNIYDEIESSRFWPKGLLDGWLGKIDEGYAAIEHYESTDPELYETLRKHLLLESMFPRFALLRLYPGKYSKNRLQQMRQQFKEDCATLNITMQDEYTSFDGLFSEWGVS